jgi:chromosome segregation protein
MSARKLRVYIEKDKAENARKDIDGYIDQTRWRMDKHDLGEIPNLLGMLKHTTTNFFAELCDSGEQNPYISVDSNEIEKELTELNKNLQEARVLFEICNKGTKEQENLLLEIQNNLELERENNHTEEKELYENRVKKSELEGLISKVTLENSILLQKIERFQEEIQEGVAVVGNSVLEYKNYNDDSTDVRLQSELYKKIERLKIKLEDAQVTNASDLMSEHQEVTSRDEFLRREIEDLFKTKKDLSDLIADLASTLDKEFTVGVQKINTQFTMFFTDMFSGGSAELFEVQKEKRIRKKSDEVLDTEITEEGETETGIDVRVSLPGKKVRDISMLSGGERALTSIALLFAISGVNPPPFMVLDETDAALDESNARRYGKSLKHLAKHSKLVVITHNRETMNQADALYGVTVGKDGASKVLSVAFDEASEYAK